MENKFSQNRFLRNKILKILTIIMIFPSASLVAGSSDFFGGFAGGATGSMLGTAISRPREKTVIIQQPVAPAAPADNTQLRMELERQLRSVNRLEAEKQELKQEVLELREEVKKLINLLSKK